MGHQRIHLAAIILIGTLIAIIPFIPLIAVSIVIVWRPVVRSLLGIPSFHKRCTGDGSLQSSYNVGIWAGTL